MVEVFQDFKDGQNSLINCSDKVELNISKNLSSLVSSKHISSDNTDFCESSDLQSGFNESCRYSNDLELSSDDFENNSSDCFTGCKSSFYDNNYEEDVVFDSDFESSLYNEKRLSHQIELNSKLKYTVNSISTGREEREKVEQFNFISFESEKDMIEFTELENVTGDQLIGLQSNDELTTSDDIYTPDDTSNGTIFLKKTEDITKIKGWKSKRFDFQKVSNNNGFIPESIDHKNSVLENLSSLLICDDISSNEPEIHDGNPHLHYDHSRENASEKSDTKYEDGKIIFSKSSKNTNGIYKSRVSLSLIDTISNKIKTRFSVEDDSIKESVSSYERNNLNQTSDVIINSEPNDNNLPLRQDLELTPTRSKSAFVSDALEDFLKSHAKLNITYKLSNLKASEHINHPVEDIFPPKSSSPVTVRREIKKNTDPNKPKTLAEKRKRLEEELRKKSLKRSKKQLKKKSTQNFKLDYLSKYISNESITYDKSRFRNHQSDKNLYKESRHKNDIVKICKKKVAQHHTNDMKLKFRKKAKLTLGPRGEFLNCNLVHLRKRLSTFSNLDECLNEEQINKHQCADLYSKKVGMILHVGLGRHLFEEAAHNLELIQNNMPIITEDFASFAAAAVLNKNPLRIPSGTKILVPVLCSKLIDLYQKTIPKINETKKSNTPITPPNMITPLKICEPKKSTVSKTLTKKCNTPIIPPNMITPLKKCEPKKSTVSKTLTPGKEIVQIMNDILSFITDKESHDNCIYDFDPFVPVIEDKLEDKKPNKGKEKNLKNFKKQTERKMILQLKKINASYVDVSEKSASEGTTNPDSEKCLEKEYCKFGCVCVSMRDSDNIERHCKKIDCVFGCECVMDTLCSNVIVESKARLWQSNEAIKQHELKLAKEEKEYHQTVIKSNNKIIVVGSSNKKRNIKLPVKFRDSEVYLINGCEEGISNRWESSQKKKSNDVKKPIGNVILERRRVTKDKVFRSPTVHKKMSAESKKGNCGETRLTSPDKKPSNGVMMNSHRKPSNEIKRLINEKEISLESSHKLSKSRLNSGEYVVLSGKKFVLKKCSVLLNKNDISNYMSSRKELMKNSIKNIRKIGVKQIYSNTNKTTNSYIDKPIISGLFSPKYSSSEKESMGNEKTILRRRRRNVAMKRTAKQSTFMKTTNSPINKLKITDVMSLRDSSSEEQLVSKNILSNFIYQNSFVEREHPRCKVISYRAPSSQFTYKPVTSEISKFVGIKINDDIFTILEEQSNGVKVPFIYLKSLVASADITKTNVKVKLISYKNCKDYTALAVFGFKNTIFLGPYNINEDHQLKGDIILGNNAISIPVVHESTDTSGKSIKFQWYQNCVFTPSRSIAKPNVVECLAKLSLNKIIQFNQSSQDEEQGILMPLDCKVLFDISLNEEASSNKETPSKKRSFMKKDVPSHRVETSSTKRSLLKKDGPFHRVETSSRKRSLLKNDITSQRVDTSDEEVSLAVPLIRVRSDLMAVASTSSNCSNQVEESNSTSLSPRKRSRIMHTENLNNFSSSSENIDSETDGRNSKKIDRKKKNKNKQLKTSKEGSSEEQMKDILLRSPEFVKSTKVLFCTTNGIGYLPLWTKRGNLFVKNPVDKEMVPFDAVAEISVVLDRSFKKVMKYKPEDFVLQWYILNGVHDRKPFDEKLLKKPDVVITPSGVITGLELQKELSAARELGELFLEPHMMDKVDIVTIVNTAHALIRKNWHIGINRVNKVNALITKNSNLTKQLKDLKRQIKHQRRLAKRNNKDVHRKDVRNNKDEVINIDLTNEPTSPIHASEGVMNDIIDIGSSDDEDAGGKIITLDDSDDEDYLESNGNRFIGYENIMRDPRISNFSSILTTRPITANPCEEDVHQPNPKFVKISKPVNVLYKRVGNSSIISPLPSTVLQSTSTSDKGVCGTSEDIIALNTQNTVTSSRVPSSLILKRDTINPIHFGRPNILKTREYLEAQPTASTPSSSVLLNNHYRPVLVRYRPSTQGTNPSPPKNLRPILPKTFKVSDLVREPDESSFQNNNQQQPILLKKIQTQNLNTSPSTPNEMTVKIYNERNQNVLQKVDSSIFKGPKTRCVKNLNDMPTQVGLKRTLRPVKK